MKVYGNLINRFDENKIYSEIKVGTPITQYLYSDRFAWEIIEVINDKEFIAREYDAIRIDGKGMSDVQEYKYKSNPNNSKVHLLIKNNKWYEVDEYTLEKYNGFNSQCEKDMYVSHLTETRKKRLLLGKKVIVKRKSSYGWSVGVADAYYDFSF